MIKHITNLTDHLATHSPPIGYIKWEGVLKQHQKKRSIKPNTDANTNTYFIKRKETETQI